MTPRTLFIIVLRVLGILSLQNLFVSIPAALSAIFSFFTMGEIGVGLVSIIISLLAIALNLTISYFLIIKAEYLVAKLGLDLGFQEKSFEFNINTSSILRLAIIITAFLLLLTEIPNLISLLSNRLQRSNSSYFVDDSIDWSPVYFTGAKVIIGLLLIGERKRILSWLEQSMQEEKKQEP